jgi:GT2 family glycosyltransferase
VNVPKQKIRVEIVAPVHNRKAITLQCLRSISRLLGDSIDVHTIIVDDGSTDGTEEAIRSDFPNVEIVPGNGDLWFTEGTNAGIRAALKHDPDYVLMINDDQVFDSRALEFMVETASRHGKAIVGPLLLLWDTPHKLFQTAPIWSTWSGGWRHWYEQTVWSIPSSVWKVDIIVGNCVLVPAAAFAEAGLMDSRRFPNFGDAEFTPRLKRLGWELLIDPRARVFCQPNCLPARVRSMGPVKMFNALVLDLKNSHNLRRRLYEYLAGAPTKIHGLAAFVTFLFRAVTGTGSEIQRTGSEPSLKDVFADRTVKDESSDR